MYFKTLDIYIWDCDIWIYHNLLISFFSIGHLCCLLFYGLFFGAILETLTGGFLEVLWVFFCIWCKVWIKSFFKHGYPIFPASFVEKTILSPINYLYSKSTDYIYTCGSTDLLMYLYIKTTLFRLLYFYKNWSYIV